MNISIIRLIGAAFALLFIAAACASNTGSTWTFAPVAVSDTVTPGEADVEAITDVEAGYTDPNELPSGKGNAEVQPTDPVAETPADGATDGEPRVIELEATAALRFAQNGEVINDIPVTPGETILFRVDNTAGFPHNLYIGTDEELSIPAGTTDSGTPDWASGIQEFEWVVPDDITGLKFGCTVPGHYPGGMQGVFSIAEGSIEPTTPTEPAASEAPAETMVPISGSGDPETGTPTDVGTSGEPRVIELEATAALQFTQNGERVTDIPVTPGETILFRIDNTAGFDHNFYIGADAELSVPSATTGTGIPNWTSGIQELTWTVPDDIAGLMFGCTVPGHYALMQGVFSIAEGSTEPTTPTDPAAETPADGATDGGPRVIDVEEIEATGALAFTQDGERLTDIPVTPGETILFRVDNTAGFDHNFYIGTDEQLSVPSATTDAGIANWASGVQEFEWVVTDDLTGLKFGCTVPGHYTLMQGIFSMAEGSTEPTTPTEPMVPAESVAPDTGSAGAADARVINLEATAALQFTQNGERITDIPVIPGERIVIRVDNTAGFAHNFYIGTDEQLSVPSASTDIGIPEWNSGVQFFDWEVPADVTSLKFGCTVPGHYTLMQGTYSILS